MRFDMYGLIHKAQRKYLFDLSSLLAKMDPKDEQHWQEVETKLTWIVEHLKQHAHSEKTYIFPLIQAVSNTHESLDAQHHDQDEELDKLLALSQKRDAKKLYSALNLFIASYLQHQAEEEQNQEDVIWKHYTDAQILGAMSKFFASKSEEFHTKNAEFVVPTMNIYEIKGFFSRKG